MIAIDVEGDSAFAFCIAIDKPRSMLSGIIGVKVNKKPPKAEYALILTLASLLFAIVNNTNRILEMHASGFSFNNGSNQFNENFARNDCNADTNSAGLSGGF